MRGVACALAMAGLLGCAGMRGGEVSLGERAEVQDVRTGKERAERSTALDRTQAEQVSVSSIYGALDREVARIAVLAGLVALGLLLGAAASPSPSEPRLMMALYAAAALCFAAALMMAWRGFL